MTTRDTAGELGEINRLIRTAEAQGPHGRPLDHGGAEMSMHDWLVSGLHDLRDSISARPTTPALVPVEAARGPLLEILHFCRDTNRPRGFKIRRTCEIADHALAALTPVTQDGEVEKKLRVLGMLYTAAMIATDGAEDEGDRAYFGSTNDLDGLREACEAYREIEYDKHRARTALKAQEKEN